MGVGKHEKFRSFQFTAAGQNKRVPRSSQGSRTDIRTRAENGSSWLGLAQRANRD